ncbi:hypothetical protein BY458DRAFT_498660 [Sporodiniella umbellata]|nr:hypothetical protein BY458DRAFT_498660 [Sporodiniella umbellata]
MNKIKQKSKADRLNQVGLQSKEDLTAFISLVGSGEPFVECVLKTQDAECLKAFAEHEQVAVMLRDALMNKVWDGPRLRCVVSKLQAIPFPKRTLMKHDLYVRTQALMIKARERDDHSTLGSILELTEHWEKTQRTRKKTVRFSDPLVSIRLYSPEQWEEEASLSTVAWYTPLLLNITRQPVTTEESQRENRREEMTMSKTYLGGEKFIPPSPEEPDEIADWNLNTSVIPTRDIDSPKKACLSEPIHFERLFEANPTLLDSLKVLVNKQTQPPYKIIKNKSNKITHKLLEKN